MTRLRNYRTFYWADTSRRLGGEPQYSLNYTDTLQYFDGESWCDVPLVQAERPPKPESRQMQEMRKQMDEAFSIDKSTDHDEQRSKN